MSTLIKQIDIENIVTSIGSPGTDDNLPTEKAVRDAIVAGSGGSTAADKLQSFIAGENLNVNEHVCLGPYAEGFYTNADNIKQYSATAGNSPITVTINYGCSFDRPVNAPIGNIALQLLLASTGNGNQSASFTYNLNVRIYNITGTYGSTSVDTGAALATSNTITGTLNFTQTLVNPIFTFTNPPLLNVGQYALKLEGTLVLAPGVHTITGLIIYGSLAGGYSGNDIDGINPVLNTSMAFEANSTPVAALVSNASSASRLRYLGYSTQTANKGQNILIKTRGNVFQSGATNNGELWYMSNTNGTLSTTPGTTKVFVGQGNGSNSISLRGLVDVNNQIGQLYNGTFGANFGNTIYFTAGGGLLNYSISAWSGDNRRLSVQTSSDGVTWEEVSFEVAPFSSFASGTNRTTMVPPNKFIRFQGTVTVGSFSATVSTSFIPF